MRQPGDTLGEYCIKSIIKDGSITTVYKCTDLEDNYVSLKLFDKPEMNTMVNVNYAEHMFKTEVTSLKKIRDNNVVRYIDSGKSEDGLFYIVTELVEGETLKDAMKRVSQYDMAKKLSLAKGILHGVEAFHRKKIVHRDLKPENIMVTSQDDIKIIDFGISYIQEIVNEIDVLKDCYTEKYCSPEQFSPKELNGDKIDKRSDIYSIGIIFSELFEEELEWEPESNDKTTSLRKIVDKMCEKQREMRYRAVNHIKADLEAYENSINESYVIMRCDIEKQWGQFVKQGIITENITDNEVAHKAKWDHIKKLVNEDICGSNYMRTEKDAFYLYGKKYCYKFGVDLKNYDRFYLYNVNCLLPVKTQAVERETGYLLPYRVKITTDIDEPKYPWEISAEHVKNELRQFENEKRREEEYNKNIDSKLKPWEEIIEIANANIKKKEHRVGYNSFTFDKESETLTVDIKGNAKIELQVGDEVQMTTEDELEVTVGIITFIDRHKVVISINGRFLSEYHKLKNKGILSVDMTLQRIAFKRQKKALRSFRTRNVNNDLLCDAVFTPSDMRDLEEYVILETEDCKSVNIDESKRIALEKALSTKDIFLLQGPPGTGKTTFIAELVNQIINGNKKRAGDSSAKILITSQSHIAVDNSLEKIRKLMPEIKLVRYGDERKLSDEAKDYTIEKVVKRWTEEIIKKSEQAIGNLKKLIMLDAEHKEKAEILELIEMLTTDVKNLQKEVDFINVGISRKKVILQKWKKMSTDIEEMGARVSDYLTINKDHEIDNVMDAFARNISTMKMEVEAALYEVSISTDIISQMEDEKCNKLEELCEKEAEIVQWKTELGAEDNETYFRMKEELEERKRDAEYAKYIKIASICESWHKRIKKDKYIEECLRDVSVIGATCLGISKLGEEIPIDFDWVIIDEAGRATPPETFVPMCYADKVILVGDHKQLPPQIDDEIISKSELKENDLGHVNVEKSLFEMLYEELPECYKSTLKEQYRMDPVIGDFIGKIFYDNTLVNKVDTSTLAQRFSMYSNCSVVWLSTADVCTNEEKVETSFRNREEAKLIFKELEKINTALADVGYKNVAIITGYKEQKNELERLKSEFPKANMENISIEINTVDAFQGREADIVFCSLVRDNENGTIGFLSDERRLNVAFSRARELLIIVGDHKVASQKARIFKKIVEHIGNSENKGCCLRSCTDDN